MDGSGAGESGAGKSGAGNPDGGDPIGGGPLEELAGEDEFYEFPDDEEDGEPHTALPGRVEAWRRRSATGAILTGFALGLQEVFEPKKDEPSIVMETSGDPPKDLPVEADFEYGRPKQSVVNVRPWLLRGAGTDEPGGNLEHADDPPGSAGGRGEGDDHQPGGESRT